jgi:putative sugar O-methyltransferase
MDVLDMLFSIEGACKDRRSNVDDPALYGRLVAAYKAAKQIQAQSGSAYQVSNEWLPIYSASMSRVMDALNAEDVDTLMAIYNNFFRESCSSGLHGMTLDVPQHFAGDEINPVLRDAYFQDALHRIKLWLELTEGVCPIADLASNDIGNPYGYSIDGSFVRTGSDYHHYYSKMIGSLIRAAGHKVVAEIGGGFGGMAYFLMRDNPDLTYVDFDLPENVALTSFYLLSAFPDKKIALFGELDVESADLGAYDAVLLPNFMIGALGPDTVDLTFNSYSLAEMSRETIYTYLRYVNEFTAKFFFHVNHTRNSLVGAAEFPVDREKFELLFRAPALWNMGRNSDMDEYECLYKCKAMAFVRE